MKSLPTLIRLKQEQLDAKRLVLTRLETEAANIKELIETLAVEVACESEAARGDADKAFGFGDYLGRVRARRAGLEARLAEVTDKIDAAADEVALAFREMKRFELAQSLADQRAAAGAAKREQAALDDIALTGYRRAQGSGAA